MRTSTTRTAGGPGLLAVLLVLGAALLPAHDALAAKKLLFEVADPQGDDYGSGFLVYPLRTDFEKGDLDLVAFRAYARGDGTEFEVEFAKPIRIAERGAVDELGTDLTSIARHGFYTFNVDIYIDRDRKEGSGGVSMLPGRFAEVDPSNAWDRAVILTPRPNEAKSALRSQWLRSMKKSLKEETGTIPEDSEASLSQQVRGAMEENVFFPNQIRVKGSKVQFFVPNEFLGGPASAEWSYTVGVSGADLISSLDLTAKAGLSSPIADNLMAVPVSPGTWRDRFGGGREDEPLQPTLVDILVPQGENQRRVLADFSSSANKPARLRGVIPSESSTPKR